MKKIAFLALFLTIDSYATCQLVNDVVVCNNSNTYLQQLVTPPQVIYINPGVQPPLPTVIIQPQILPGRTLPPPADFSSKIVPRENINLWGDGK